MVGDTRRWSPGVLPGLWKTLVGRDLGVLDPDYLPPAEFGAGSLFWVSSEMTGLAVRAAPGLPEWVPAVVAPAESGLLVWDCPDTPRTPRVPVYGVPQSRWPAHPLGLPPNPPRAPIAAVLWATIRTQLRGMVLVRPDALSEPSRAAVADRHPLLVPACTLPFAVVTRPVATTTTPEPGHAETTAVMNLLGATWSLMGQTRLTEVAEHRPRNSGRRGATPTPVVRLIGLRRAQPAPTDGDTGDATQEPSSRYHHRWVVDGYWRQQLVDGQRRPVYVGAHIKGPTGAPLLDSPKVRVWRH